jgi:hypothetical protein
VCTVTSMPIALSSIVLNYLVDELYRNASTPVITQTPYFAALRETFFSRAKIQEIKDDLAEKRAEKEAEKSEAESSSHRNCCVML